jgi:uncharacterized ferritin-like protein (DUF455 family)
LLEADTLEAKLGHGPAPTDASGLVGPGRAARPARPSVLRLADKAQKQRGFGSPHGRARLLHTFFHHELQAAELFAWALLAYPEVDALARTGLARIVADELRHARLYAEQVERLGHRVGDFPVRDWFWSRVPAAPDLASFCAVMGMGFEAANLDHAARFEALLAQVGDGEAARVQAEVGRDEVSHVRFGVETFRRLRGGPTFAAFEAALPPPLSPMLMRGPVLDRAARQRAGLDDAFLDELTAWTASPSS